MSIVAEKMDENNIQAFKAIDVAKRMIAENDNVGARIKLLEVHYQFPSLSNVLHMITACDILRAAELILPDGETDWYWILQLGPAATISQIDSQHEKLSSLLNGIKEEFPGAATALELVHNAFSVLSNLSKRLIFNSKRLTSWEAFSFVSSVGYHFDTSTILENASPVHLSDDSKSADLAKDLSGLGKSNLVAIKLDGSDGLLQGAEVHVSEQIYREPCDVEQQKKEVSSSDAKTIPFSLDPIHEEEVENCNNLVVSSVDNDTLSESSPLDSRAMPNQRNDEDSYNFESIRKAEDFSVDQIWAAYDDENLPRRYARINAISTSPFRLHISWLQPVPQSIHERKWCEVGLPVVCGLFNLQENEEFLVEPTIFSNLASYTSSPTNDEYKIYPKKNEVWAIYKDWKPFAWCDKPESRKGCTLQIVQIIEGYPRQEGVVVADLVKVDGSQNIYKRDNVDDVECCFEIPPRCIYRFSHRLPAYLFEERESGEVSIRMFELDPLAIDASNSSIPESHQSLPSLKDSRGSSLKLEWSAEDFASGQVWAIYDGSDQMPRSYVVVNDVDSNDSVCVTYLEPHPISDEEFSCVAENIPLGCGMFTKSSVIATLKMCKFSHLVDFDRSDRIYYKIYPKKGEVWAMYRNWNSKWKKQDFDQYCCRIVEVLSDFSEDSGVLTAGLKQVPGYTTFFQRQLCDDGFTLNRVVLRSETLSFSHRVEAFAVPGIQVLGIPESSWHLEPDALPPLFAN